MEVTRFVFKGIPDRSMQYTRYGSVLLDMLLRNMKFQNLDQLVKRHTLLDGTEIICESCYGHNKVTITTGKQLAYRKEPEEELLVPLEGLVEFNATEAYMVYKTVVYPLSGIPVPITMKLKSFVPISGLVNDANSRLGAGATTSYIAALTSYTWVVKDEDDIVNSDKSMVVCKLLFFPESFSHEVSFNASELYIYNSKLPSQSTVLIANIAGVATNYYLHSDGNISIIHISMLWSEENSKYKFRLYITKMNADGTVLSSNNYEATPMIATPRYFEVNGIAGATVAYDGTSVYTNIDFVEFPYANMVVDSTKRYDYNPITGEIVELSRELSRQHGYSWTLGPQYGILREFQTFDGASPEFWRISFLGEGDPPEHHFCVARGAGLELIEATTFWTYYNCLYIATNRIHSKVYDSFGVLTEFDLDVSEIWSGELCRVTLTSEGWESWTSHLYWNEELEEFVNHWVYEPNAPTDAELEDTTATRSGKEFINYLPYMIVYFDYTQNKWVWYDFLSYYNIVMPEDPEDPIRHSCTKCIYDNTGTMIASHTVVL